MVYRIYVEKKPGFDVEATGLKNELTSLLGIQSLTGLRLLNRYDVEGIDEELFNQCANTVFSEPPVDNTYAELPASDGVSFAVEYLPGQFDQRADSAAECIQLISQGERPLVRSARVYLLEGTLTDEQVAEIKKYVINPVEAREASLDTKQTLKMEYPVPAPVKVLEGFNQPTLSLKNLYSGNQLPPVAGKSWLCSAKVYCTLTYGSHSVKTNAVTLTVNTCPHEKYANDGKCQQCGEPCSKDVLFIRNGIPYTHEGDNPEVAVILFSG